MAKALEVPKKALFPACLKEDKSFTCIIDKMLRVIETLPRSRQKKLRDYVQSAIFPGVEAAKGSTLHISSSPKKLITYMMKYCDPFNMRILQILVKHLKDEELDRQVEAWEYTRSDQLEKAKWDTEVDVAPPPAYKIMLLKMTHQSKTTLRESDAVQKFLEDQLKDPGILFLAGLASDSLVFYIFDANVGQVLMRTQEEKGDVLALGVEEITFAKHVRLDVASRGFTLHPDMTRPKERKEFGVLLIGETGSGKSTLINNLLGITCTAAGIEGVVDGSIGAKAGDTLEPLTSKITQYRGTANGVPVALYDTPGTDGLAASDKELCKDIRKLLKSKMIYLTIFCFSVNDCRFRQSHVATMQAYHNATNNWDSTVVALTFADKIEAPRAERGKETFNGADYFAKRIEDWKEKLKDALVERVHVPPAVAKKLFMQHMHPTTDQWDSRLPNNKEWFTEMWLDILDLLVPEAYFEFLEIHQNNITFDGEASTEDGCKIKISLTGKFKERFKGIQLKQVANLDCIFPRKQATAL